MDPLEEAEPRAPRPCCPRTSGGQTLGGPRTMLIRGNPLQEDEGRPADPARDPVRDPVREPADDAPRRRAGRPGPGPEASRGASSGAPCGASSGASSGTQAGTWAGTWAGVSPGTSSGSSSGASRSAGRSRPAARLTDRRKRTSRRPRSVPASGSRQHRARRTHCPAGAGPHVEPPRVRRDLIGDAALQHPRVAGMLSGIGSRLRAAAPASTTARTWEQYVRDTRDTRRSNP